MPKLILMRHGQSMWNLLNLFTGWVDVNLSPKGIEEALEGGEQIKDIPIDIIYTSTLIRAQTTAMLAMSKHHAGKVPVIQHQDSPKQDEMGKIYSPKSASETIPVIEAWQLNERMYGELQGKNKAETAEEFGKEQVHIWRRSYDTPPPKGESLKMTAERAIPYFKENIVPHLEKGETVFISAHGNSLRAITMVIENISEEEIPKLEIPTGAPIIYSYDKGNYIKETEAE